MATKYVARLNGKIVGKRTTQNRTYTHAVIVQSDLANARRKARDYCPTKTDQSNYSYALSIASCADAAEYKARFSQYTSDIEAQQRVDRARAEVENGPEAYHEHRRQCLIAAVERDAANGKFEPKVLGWCGRLDLAHKLANDKRHIGDFWLGRVDLVAIVEAEEV